MTTVRSSAARAALLCVLLSACQVSGDPASTAAPADTSAGEIPLRYVGTGEAALVVPVHINGEGPFDLVLDTGATWTCVTDEVAQRLALPDQRGAVGYGAGVQSAGRVRLVRFDSVRVGAASAADMGGCVLDLSSLALVGTQVDGLLGLNFLRSFDVRLDFARDVLTLTAP
jgi:predicted aspartyl protease